ncbi:hypothetical protein IFR05_011210 [Cadophora sp. M221]|nr:hypothetical protein IFR05_011210 [Cadophora sp. M221]
MSYDAILYVETTATNSKNVSSRNVEGMGRFVEDGITMREDLSVGQSKFPSIQGGFGNGTESKNHGNQQFPSLHMHIGMELPANCLGSVDATQLGDSFNIFDPNHGVEFQFNPEIDLWSFDFNLTR